MKSEFSFNGRFLGHPNSILLISCFTIYLVLFIQFPLSYSLPGNTDTILSIALSNAVSESISLLIQGKAAATIMFPAKNFLAYGENCLGIVFIFNFFKLILGNDFWAYYFFLSTIFALNTFALSKFVLEFVDRLDIAFVSGLILPLSAYTFGNIDDPNCIFIFFPIASIIYFIRGVNGKNVHYLRLAMLFAGIQIWFGMYVFVFNSLLLVLLCLFDIKKLKKIIQRRDILRLIRNYLVPALPILLIYFFNHRADDLVSPYDNPLSRKLGSLHWYNFWNVLPNNLLYSSTNNITRAEFDSSLWYSLRKTCFPGFVFPVVAILGLMIRGKDLKSWLCLFLLFLILAFGSNLYDLERITAIPFGSYFRVASRAYLFALIPLSLFFAIGLDRIIKLFKSKLATKIVLSFVGGIFILENVSFPLLAYRYEGILTPSTSYKNFFVGFTSRQIILDIPSDYQAKLPQSGSVWTYSRDALYMNWASYHHQIIVGGINGYLPVSRIIVDQFEKRLPDASAIQELNRIGVTYFVFHKGMILFTEEDRLQEIKKSPLLSTEFEDEHIAIMKIKINEN